MLVVKLFIYVRWEGQGIYELAEQFILNFRLWDNLRIKYEGIW